MRWTDESIERRMLCTARLANVTKRFRRRILGVQLGVLYEALKAFETRGDGERANYNDPAGRLVASDANRLVDR